jgi:hypothetical protein
MVQPVSRRAALTDLLETHRKTLLEGPGHASPELRAAAAEGKGDGALGDYVRQIHEAAYKVTAEQLKELQKAHSDDVLFEITVCAAHGAAKQRHDAGLAALDAAWETP